jgi:hypothetical protein
MGALMRALHRRYGHSRPAGLSDAVRAMRLYLGSVDYASLRDQQRLYDRAHKAAARVAASAGLPSSDAWHQIEAEARRLGKVRPVPGQHL